MSHIRNIGIYAHIDAGKTTLVENMLFQAGLIASPGSVLEGTTESDTLLEEIQRGISILSTTFQFSYKKKYLINLIDTPGHLDFTSHVDSSLLAVDIAVLMIDITAGIRSQTEFIFEKIQKQGIPLVLFINKIDSMYDDIGQLLGKIRSYFGDKVYATYTYDGEIINNLRYILNDGVEIGEDFLHFIEWDEDLTEQYLRNPSNINDYVTKGLIEGTSLCKFFPLFIGSALQGIGVIELLDFLCEVRPKTHVVREDAVAVLFQNRVHPELGKISYLKSFKRILAGDKFYIGENQVRISNLYTISLESIENQDVVGVDSIFCTNDLIDFLPPSFLAEEKNVFFATNKSEEQNLKQFAVVIEPKSVDLKEKLMRSIQELVWEGGGLSYRVRRDTGQIELWGAGELHLEVSISRLKKNVGEIFIVGNLRVARYERWKNVANTIAFEHTIYETRVSSGVLKGFVERADTFKSSVVFEVGLPGNLKQAVTAGFEEVISHGYFGHYVLGIRLRVTSYESPQHINTQTISLLKISVISGMKTLFREGNTVEIGSMVVFDITVPEEFLGSVLSALQKRNAKIRNMESLTVQKYFVKGEACSENMLGFSSVLRNMTKGKGIFSANIVLSPANYYKF